MNDIGTVLAVIGCLLIILSIVCIVFASIAEQLDDNIENNKAELRVIIKRLEAVEAEIRSLNNYTRILTEDIEEIKQDC